MTAKVFQPSTLTTERLREVLIYDPTSGDFHWRVPLAQICKARDRAGTLYKNGRRYITIDGRRYFAARLAWMYVHGSWPDGQIDHRNLDRADDRIENLREADRQGNSANRSLNRGKALPKGVIARPTTKHGTKYRARIRVNAQLISLGEFDTPEAAHDAYATAASRYFGEFARP